MLKASFDQLFATYFIEYAPDNLDKLQHTGSS